MCGGGINFGSDARGTIRFFSHHAHPPVNLSSTCTESSRFWSLIGSSTCTVESAVSGLATAPDEEPPFAWRKVRRTEGLSPSAGTAARSVALAASAGSVGFKAGACVFKIHETGMTLDVHAAHTDTHMHVPPTGHLPTNQLHT